MTFTLSSTSISKTLSNFSPSHNFIFTPPGSAPNSNPPESPTFHLRLLLFAFETALTTAVCVVEYNSWPELSAAERSKLGGLYIPYFVFGESASSFLPRVSFRPWEIGKGGIVSGVVMGKAFANTDGVSCGDVCRYVWEGQSKIDQSRGIYAEGKGFMMLAALIRSACDRGKVRNNGAECFTTARNSTTSLPTAPGNLFEASMIRNKINAYLLNIKRKEDIKRHA